MKKTLVVIGIVAAFALLFPLSAVFADTPAVGSPAWQTQNCASQESVLVWGDKCAGYDPGTSALANTDPNSTTGKILSAAGNAVSTALNWAGAISATLILTILKAIVYVLIQISIILLMFCGFLFNFVVDQLVVNMGHFITSESSSGIQTAWKIVRDLTNIGIIGGLIATAISTILQIEKYNANKLLARLIIAALLVNFSYFFTGAIIDSSNYLATQFYTNLICGNTDPTCKNTTIAGTFQDITNIQVVQSVQAIGHQVAQAGQNNAPQTELTQEALKEL